MGTTSKCVLYILVYGRDKSFNEYVSTLLGFDTRTSKDLNTLSPGNVATMCVKMNMFSFTPTTVLVSLDSFTNFVARVHLECLIGFEACDVC